MSVLCKVRPQLSWGKGQATVGFQFWGWNLQLFGKQLFLPVHSISQFHLKEPLVLPTYDWKTTDNRNIVEGAILHPFQSISWALCTVWISRRKAKQSRVRNGFLPSILSLLLIPFLELSIISTSISSQATLLCILKPYPCFLRSQEVPSCVSPFSFLCAPLHQPSWVSITWLSLKIAGLEGTSTD